MHPHAHTRTYTGGAYASSRVGSVAERRRERESARMRERERGEGKVQATEIVCE